MGRRRTLTKKEIKAWQEGRLIRQPKYDEFYNSLTVPETIGLRGKSALEARGFSPDEIEEIRKSLIRKAKKARIKIAINKYY